MISVAISKNLIRAPSSRMCTMFSLIAVIYMTRFLISHSILWKPTSMPCQAQFIHSTKEDSSPLPQSSHAKSRLSQALYYETSSSSSFRGFKRAKPKMDVHP